MRRLNFLEDEPWDEVHDDKRVRWFGHPLETDMLGASLTELPPGSSRGPLHMHYGVEEMFFVLAGTPTVRTQEGEEELSPGDVVYFPEKAQTAYTTSRIRQISRLGYSASRPSASPMSSPIRSAASLGSRRAIPSDRCLKAETPASSLASSHPQSKYASTLRPAGRVTTNHARTSPKSKETHAAGAVHHG
jgi:hypothetical protein